MKPAKDIFIGRPIYWSLWLIIIALLTALGMASFHVREFVAFQFIVLGLAVAVVIVIVIVYREGERVTRQPFDQDQSPPKR